jgi:uncharacterized protein
VTVLLDGNVLVALAVADHVHHEAASRWFAGVERFASCPITQGTVVRLLLRENASIGAATGFLAALSAHAGHEFWADDVPYDTDVLRGVIGHRQVTDSYLAALARRRSGRLATFDVGMAASHDDVSILIPTTMRPASG